MKENSLFSPAVRYFPFTVFVLCTTLFTLTTRLAFAEKTVTDEWNIEADKISQFENPSTIVAQGNVVLIKKEKLPPRKAKKNNQLSSWAELLGDNNTTQEITTSQGVQNTQPHYTTTVTIKADWMTYDTEHKVIKAKGNLSIVTPEDRLSAKEGQLDLNSETGAFREAVVIHNDHDLHLEGQVIEKTGYQTYAITDGWAITCKVPTGKTSPWSIASAKTTVTQDGYAVLKHARFRVYDVPIFYSPWLIIPVKNKRQTGFLVPEFSYSKNGGFGFGVPFFWNISDSVDMTFYPTYFIDRGLMAGAEFRITTGEESKAMFSVNYLHDTLSDPTETDYYSNTDYTHDNQNRYWLRGKANIGMPAGWLGRLDVDMISDEDYLKEFDFGETGFDTSQDRYIAMFGRNFENDTDYERSNSLKFLKSWGGISIESNLLAINDVLDKKELITTTTTDTDGNVTTTEHTVIKGRQKEENKQDIAINPNNNTVITRSDADTPLWKLPELKFDGTIDAGFLDFTFDWETSYVNYWRESGVGGSRIDLRPALSTPIKISPYLESRAEIAVRETYYSLENFGDSKWLYDHSQNRFYPELELDFATTLQRDFGSNTNVMRNELRPYLKYFYIPKIDNQNEIPQWDSVDSVVQKNRLTYGLDSLWSNVTGGTVSERLRTYASFLIEQSYNMDEDNEDEPFSDIYSKVSWHPFAGSSLSYKAYYDVYESEFNRHNAELLFSNNSGNYFGAEYSYNLPSDLEQINVRAGVKLIDTWKLAGEIKHSIASETTNEATGAITYMANCWSITFKTRYTPGDMAYMLMFELANLGAPLGLSF